MTLYGLPEALFDDRTVQSYPVDYNYDTEPACLAAAGTDFWGQAPIFIRTGRAVLQARGLKISACP